MENLYEKKGALRNCAMIQIKLIYFGERLRCEIGHSLSSDTEVENANVYICIYMYIYIYSSIFILSIYAFMASIGTNI